MNKQSRPRQAPWVVADDLPDHGIRLVRNRNAEQPINLNPTSALIWRNCNGETSIDDLVALFVEAYPDVTGIQEDIERTVRELVAQGALLLDGGASALEYSGDVVRKLSPGVELIWQLEKIRRFLFDVLRMEELDPIPSNLEDLLGPETLLSAKSRDLNAAQASQGDSTVIYYLRAMRSPSFAACVKSISAELRTLLPEVETKIRLSGNALYRPGAHMGWHSNHQDSDGRIYCSWAEKPDANYFRYEHPLTGEIVTEWEKPGWNIKSFTIPSSPARFWHCIGASSLRFSMGFRYNLPEQRD